jgi:hypothetical protein
MGSPQLYAAFFRIIKVDTIPTHTPNRKNIIYEPTGRALEYPHWQPIFTKDAPMPAPIALVLPMDVKLEKDFVDA